MFVRAESFDHIGEPSLLFIDLVVFYFCATISQMHDLLRLTQSVFFEQVNLFVLDNFFIANSLNSLQLLRVHLAEV